MNTWKIDAAHSEVQFKVKHLVISTVTGNFKSFNAEMTADDDQFNNAKISFTADVNSIDTGVAQRDEHLKSDDFFNAASFPQLKFASTSFTKKDDEEFILKGNLTIRDITKTVELEVEYGGTMVDPYGNVKSGFEIKGKINRQEFGLKWSAMTEAGGVVVSDDVKLLMNIQMMKV